MNLPLPKQCGSWPILGACPAVLQTPAFQHCQTPSNLLLLFSKTVASSQIILLLSPSTWTILCPLLLLQSQFGSSCPPRVPTKVSPGRTELPQVTLPQKQRPFPDKFFPFPAQFSGTSSLPTFGYFVYSEADEASKTLSLTFRAANF